MPQHGKAKTKQKFKYKLKNEEKLKYKINERVLLVGHDNNAFPLPMLYFADNSTGRHAIQNKIVSCTRISSLCKFLQSLVWGAIFSTLPFPPTLQHCFIWDDG